MVRFMKSWSSLQPSEQFKLCLQAYDDPVFFAENEYFMDQQLWDSEKWVLREFDRKVNGERVYNELLFIAGMRSMKTYLGGLINCNETFRLLQLEDPAKHFGLAKGTEIFLINVATNDRQARDTIFARTKAFIDNSPWFQAQNYREIYDEFRFPDKNIVIRSGGSNSSSIVGRTTKIAFFDELSRFLNTQGQRSGKVVYESLGRSVSTFKMDGLRVVTSSPLYVDDVVMELEKEVKGLPNVMLIHKPTWELNPNLPLDGPFMQNELKRNKEAFWRDFGAKPSYSIEAFFREPQLLQLNKTRINFADYDVLPAPGPWHYLLSCDVASKLNSYGVAMGHREAETAVIDLMTRFTPKPGITEVDVKSVTKYLQTLITQYAIDEVAFDIAGYPETIQEIRSMSVEIQIHNPLKPEYDRLKELAYVGRLDLCNYPFVIEELQSLELIKGKQVHTSKSKDVADSLANLVWLMFHAEESKEKKKLSTPLYISMVRKRW
jgi:hypothetical protein